MAKKAASKSNSIVGTYEEIRTAVASAEEDVTKFAAGNKAAGVRVRKMALEVKNLCARIRKEVSAAKK